MRNRAPDRTWQPPPRNQGDGSAAVAGPQEWRDTNYLRFSQLSRFSAYSIPRLTDAVSSGRGTNRASVTRKLGIIHRLYLNRSAGISADDSAYAGEDCLAASAAILRAHSAWLVSSPDRRC